MFYIAMEFIEGTTLQRLLAEKRALSPEETIRICRQICKGLDYAHSAGIVHRDIKPGDMPTAYREHISISDSYAGREYAALSAKRRDTIEDSLGWNIPVLSAVRLDQWRMGSGQITRFLEQT